MLQTPLSKSDCLSASACAPWEPGYQVQWRFADSRFAVADWACDGRHRADANHEESPRHFELYVQRCGWHRRRLGRRELVMDALQPGLWPQAQPFALRDNAGHRQSALIAFLSPEFLESVLAEVPGAQSQDWQRLSKRPTLLPDPMFSLQLARLQRLPCGNALAWQEGLQTALYHLLASSLGRGEESSRNAVGNAAALIETKRFLCAHYQDPLQLEQIASATGLSASRLSVLFRREFGQSIWRYVRDLRLQAALNLLPNAAGELSAIAHELGFASHSHLTQAFKARFGIAPSQVFSASAA